MQFIILLPMAASLYVAMTRSAQAAFLGVYRPVLLLLPDYFRCTVPCLHRFAQAAIFGLAFGLRPRLKFSPMDVLVAGFALAGVITEVQRSIFSDAVSLAVDNLSDIVLPYLCGKYLIEQNGLRSQTARRFVILMLAVAAVSPYEFLSGRDPFFLFFYKFFEQWPRWILAQRWGFWRINGPYGGSILAGCIFLCAILLQVWLWSTGKWERRTKWLPFPGHAGIIVLLGLAAGSFMTLSRGPWMGLLFALPIATIGFTKNVIRSALVVAAVSVTIGLFLYSGIDKYTDTSWEKVENQEQQNAFYRRELFTVYEPYIEQGGLWGWGRAGRPSVHNMESIDNEFLLVEVMYGKIGLAIFVAIGIWSMITVLRSALTTGTIPLDDMRFQFILVAIIAGLAVSVTTVYLGLQVKPVFFLFVGWAEGTLVFRSSKPRDLPDAQNPKPAFAFSQVLR
jgi:hypothetical protein